MRGLNISCPGAAFPNDYETHRLSGHALIVPLTICYEKDIAQPMSVESPSPNRISLQGTVWLGQCLRVQEVSYRQGATCFRIDSSNLDLLLL